MTTIVISPFNVVNFPEGGGHFWVYMQYAQALRLLGCDVYWLENFRPSGDEAADRSALETFFKRLETEERWEGELEHTTRDGRVLTVDSHMAYARDGRCPAGHPVAVPALSLVYAYPARAVDAARAIGLSSGGQYTGHADFINAWNEQALTKLVRGCLDDADVRPTLDPTQSYNHC